MSILSRQQTVTAENFKVLLLPALSRLAGVHCCRAGPEGSRPRSNLYPVERDKLPPPPPPASGFARPSLGSHCLSSGVGNKTRAATLVSPGA